MAHYEMDDGYIRSRNFTDGTDYNFEPISSIMGENEDYSECFDAIYAISPQLAEQYLRIVWLDTVCYNMDRHTENFGFLRDAHTGKIESMAPNYDNNIALISRGYLDTTDRTRDGLVRFFREFLRENQTAKQLYQSMALPTITGQVIDCCLEEVPFEVDRDYIRAFILNGQSAVQEIIQEDVEVSEADDPAFNLTM